MQQPTTLGQTSWAKELSLESGVWSIVTIQFTYLDYQAFYICPRHMACHSLPIPPDSPCLYLRPTIYDLLIYDLIFLSLSSRILSRRKPISISFFLTAFPLCNRVYISVEVGRVIQQPQAYRRNSLGGAIPVAVLNTEYILRSYCIQNRPATPPYRLLPDSVSHFVNCLQK